LLPSIAYQRAILKLSQAQVRHVLELLDWRILGTNQK
jgi:hypothetical protein